MSRTTQAYKEYVRTPNSQGIRPMQTNPAVVKRNVGQRSVSTRRFMVDYQSELDIREAISESDPKDQFRNQLDPLEQLTMSLRITQTMIQFVSAPNALDVWASICFAGPARDRHSRCLSAVPHLPIVFSLRLPSLWFGIRTCIQQLRGWWHWPYLASCLPLRS